MLPYLGHVWLWRIWCLSSSRHTSRLEGGGGEAQLRKKRVHVLCTDHGWPVNHGKGRVLIGQLYLARLKRFYVYVPSAAFHIVCWSVSVA